MFTKVLAFLKRNPALVSAAFSVVVVVAAGFGFKLDATQVALISSILSAVLGVTVHAVTVPASKADHGKP